LSERPAISVFFLEKFQPKSNCPIRQYMIPKILKEVLKEVRLGSGEYTCASRNTALDYQ